MSRLFYHTMQDNAGNLLFGVSGTMRLAGTGTLATIYGDPALSVILPNPMTNHVSFGSFKCYLAPGSYDFYMAKAGYTFETLTGVQGLGTMAGQESDHITGALQIDGGVGIGMAPEPGQSLSAAASVHIAQNLLVGGSSKLVGNVGIGRDFDPANSLSTLGHVAIGGQLAVTGGLTGAQAVFAAVTATPGAGDNVNAYHSAINAGTGRYALNMNGNAPSYLGGHTVLPAGAVLRLGTATPVPSYNARAEILHSPTIVGIEFQPSADTTPTACHFRNAAGSSVGSIVTSATATTYNSASDARLKSAITPLTGALDVVRALRPVAFRWNADDSPGRGFVAEEVQEVIPEGVITGARDAVEEDGSIRPQMIDHSKLVVYLVGACKELATQVAALTARLEAAGA
jgi:hypothetical protein